MDKETESQSGQVTCSRSHNSKGGRSDWTTNKEKKNAGLSLEMVSSKKSIDHFLRNLQKAKSSSIV
jgi:hypothetical protein